MTSPNGRDQEGSGGKEVVLIEAVTRLKLLLLLVFKRFDQCFDGGLSGN